METADVAALRREQADLRKRLDAIDAKLKDEQGPEREVERERGVTVTISVPRTGFQRPTADELQELARRVDDEHDWLVPCSEDAFARAFTAVGFMFRLPEPSRKLAFSAHVNSANSVLERLGLSGVAGNALLAAMIAHSDVPWRAQAMHLGQPLECGLHPFAGRPCSNAYRRVLAGEPLTPPLPPRPLPGAPSVPLPRFSIRTA